MKLAITLLFLSIAVQGWTQDEASQPSGQSSWHPSLNGDTGSLAFSGEAERVNQLSGGVTLSSTYDDNALSSGTNQIGNIGYGVMPNISITEVRTRALWTFNYNPGFVWNQRMSPQYQASHNLDFNGQYRLTEHLSARIHDNFVDQSSSFNQVTQNPLLPGGNVLSQPNQSVITPLAKQLSNLTNADLQDQMGEATNIGMSGSFNKLSFQEASSGPIQLYNNESWSGAAFYSHHLSVRHSVGTTYTFQDFLTFGQSRERSQSQSIVLFYTFDPKPGLTFSIFAGPDYSTTNSQFQLALGPFLIPINHTESMWLADEGVNFSWQGQKTSARINFIHHVTDGGGLTGAVQIYSGTVGLRRQISKTLTGDLALNYGDNNPLSHTFGGAFSGYSGSIGVERLIASHVSVAMRYGRAYQRYGEYGVGTTNSSANHNQAFVTVNYHFSRPLGR
jgi:hypothetical protein